LKNSYLGGYDFCNNKLVNSIHLKLLYKGGIMATYLTGNMQFFGDLINNQYVVLGAFLVIAFFMVIVTFAMIPWLIRGNQTGGN